MKKILSYFLGFMLSTLSVSCYYDDIIPRPVEDIPDDVVVLFANDIQPIFNGKCVACHDGDRDPDLREGNSYNALVPEYVVSGDAENSELYQIVVGGHPAPASAALNDGEIALMKAWIDRGADDN